MFKARASKRKSKTDIRFNRIAVSVFDTRPLKWYFTNRSVMEKATIYCDVYELWKRIEADEILKTAEFLQTLYNDDPNKFSNLLTYIVNNLPKYFDRFYRAPYYSMDQKTKIMMGKLSWFFHELETIGVIWDGKGFHLAVGTTKLDVEITSCLESMLSEFGTEYLVRYNGAIEALMSDNPDHLCQSVSSMRELLTDILHLLTEGDSFVDDELTDKGIPKRNARIRHILSRSKGLGAEAGVTEALANSLDKIYGALSKGFHVTSKDWKTILYIFKSTEYLIYYVLLNK